MEPYRATIVCNFGSSPAEPDPLTTSIIAALAIAFAAFCVWLTVRIVNRRERWAKWMLAASLALAAAYPLSIGPLQWLDQRSPLPGWADKPIEIIYAPLSWTTQRSEVANAAIDWYIDLWLGPDE